MPRHHPGNRKGLRMITDILRLKEMGLGTGKIAKALKISRNTVKSYLHQQERAVACGLVGSQLHQSIRHLGPP